MMQVMLLRLAYLGVTTALAMLRLLPMGDHDKDVLALRYQITVLERQLHGERPRFTPAGRALLAALLHRLSRDVLHRIRLLARPDTVLRWHRDLLAHRHAKMSRPQRPGRRTSAVAESARRAAAGTRYCALPRRPTPSARAQTAAAAADC